MRTTRMVLAIATTILATLSADARNPPQVPVAASPSAPQRGGRGRGAIARLSLVAEAWADGAEIPLAHAQGGGEASPALAWDNVPDGVASFVLIMHDLDAPVAPGTDDTLHWMLWNIPGTTRKVAARTPQGGTLPDGTRQISVTGPNYRGPWVAVSSPAHHYVFELYALDVMLDVPAVGAPPALTRAAVVAAMGGHVRGKGVYTGVFRHAP